MRLLEHGDADDVGDVVAAGDGEAIVARLQRFRDAGVTDLAARVLPLGRRPRRSVRKRARAFLDTLTPELLTTPLLEVAAPIQGTIVSLEVREE